MYREAHARLPESRKDSPEWKVLLYILTSSTGLWERAEPFTLEELGTFDWNGLLRQDGLTESERGLLELAEGLTAFERPVTIGAILVRLDQHAFEVAEKAIRLRYQFLRGKTPL